MQCQCRKPVTVQRSAVCAVCSAAVCNMRCALLVCTMLAVARSAPPNIIVIIADDMGWNDVSFHGSSQILTPNIDALAYQGVILNRHYVQPSCSPSRAALLTGRFPAHTGMQVPIGAGSTSALALNFTLLPQHLRKLGYQTHLVGKWHLGSHSSQYLPTHRGFVSHFGFWNGFLGYFDGIHYDGKAGIDARRNEAGAWEEFVGHYSTDLFTQEATSVVRSHDVSDGPLYLQVALSAPHTGNKGSELEVRDLGENEQQHSYIPGLHRRLYAGMVRGVDDAVGAILEALRSTDLLNNSIVLFTSDNGAPSLDPQWNYTNYGSNWPLRGMKMSCHEGGVRSAAALWSPLVEGGRVSEQLIHIVDWLPTLYSAAGGDERDLGKIDGVNQWESLRSVQSTADQREELLVELNPVVGNEAVIKWPWKIVQYSSRNPFLNIHAGESGRGPEVPQYSVAEVISSVAARALTLQHSVDEVLALRALATIDQKCLSVVNQTISDQPCDKHYCLFNLASDPCESSDVSHLYPDIVTDLQSTLDSYRGTLVPSTPSDYDPRADPRLWSNYWAPWDDPSGATQTTPLILLLTSCLMIMRV